jgi:ABC transporter substrate binding protein (PQQ-dependent alcohol dehydrogenase system)
MASSSMTNSLAAVLLFLVLAVPAFAQDAPAVRFAYVDRQCDPFYARRESYGGIYDATRKSALAGAELGVKDARIIGRALGVTFELIHDTIPEGAAAAEHVRQLVRREKAVAAILDLPAGDIEAVAAAFGPDGPALFNIRHRDGGLRRNTCASNLFHVMPSDAMFNDALAQYLKLLGWEEVLVLASDAPADLAQSESFQNSARKFGLEIADVRQFVHGNDPRQRDHNNVRLLTAAADYDVVFVADETGEFARLVQYRTASPRPVVGTAGLSPLAWHPHWERHGAPQLNRRLFRQAKRTMTGEDWAAWVAVKAAVEAHVKAAGSGATVAHTLLRPEFTLELYKGFPGSFRPWDHQLRQPILLGTTDAVIALAPVEGALHQFNTLDTLGTDEPEFQCPAR